MNVVKKSPVKDMVANDVSAVLVVCSTRPVGLARRYSSGPMRASEWIALAKTVDSIVSWFIRNRCDEMPRKGTYLQHSVRLL